MEEVGDSPCLGNWSSTEDPTLDYSLADTYKVVTGTIIFCGTLPMVLFEFRFFPIGTTTATLLGAMLMVIFRVVTQQEAYSIVGNREHMAALFLMVGVLILAQYFEREQILVRVLRKFFTPNMRFESYLFGVCLLACVLSGFFTSDMVCIVFVPLMLKVWEIHERPRSELEVILLGLATSANIGTVITIFGNISMALIATKTTRAEFYESRLDMQRCVMYLLPVALVGFFLNYGFLVLYYRLQHRNIPNAKLVSEASHSEQEVAGLTASTTSRHNGNHYPNGFVKSRDEGDLLYEGAYNGPAALLAQQREERMMSPCQLETIPEDDILEIPSSQNSSLRDCAEIDSPISSVSRQSAGSRPTVSTVMYTVNPDLIEHLDSDSSSSSDEDIERLAARPRNIDENLRQLNIEYRPNALQSRSQNLASINDSTMSLSKCLDNHGLQVFRKLGIFRSQSAFSLVDFLPSDGMSQHLDADGGPVPRPGSPYSPSDSVIFLGLLWFLMGSLVILLLATTPHFTLDIGKLIFAYT